MISVIIPTINHVDLVKQCVHSFRETVKDILYEMIVVDDGSPIHIQDPLKEWADEAGVHFILKPTNTGFSSAVNEGIRRAAGEYILLVNNDIVFHQAKWLEKMLQVTASEPLAGIVGARLLYPDQTIQHAGTYPAKNGFFNHRFRGYPADYPPALAVEEFQAVTGALMLIKKEVIEDIGTFAEEFFIAFEDVDFCYRAKQKEWKIIYCGTASAIHLEGKTRGTRLSNKNRIWRRKELESRRLFWQKWGRRESNHEGN